jgi:hypothetical protein
VELSRKMTKRFYWVFIPLLHILFLFWSR